MTENSGKTAPLHRRYNPDEIMGAVRKRYTLAREQLSDQVAVLQESIAFRKIAAGLYARGYKDWSILMGIMSRMMDLRGKEIGLDPMSEEGRSKYEELHLRLSGHSYSPSCFTDDHFLNNVEGHNMAALVTYGFEIRRSDFHTDSVERFLRYRMKHFDFDLPHDEMFGDPRGDWPEL